MSQKLIQSSTNFKEPEQNKTILCDENRRSFFQVPTVPPLRIKHPNTNVFFNGLSYLRYIYGSFS